MILNSDDKSNGTRPSSVTDGLAASATWRRGQLSKLSDKFNDDDESGESQSVKKDKELDIIDNKMNEPSQINNDEEVQQMWKDMENRVTRRRSITLSEAKMKGKSVGKNNIRRTDEEAWLEAGVYQEEEHLESNIL